MVEVVIMIKKMVHVQALRFNNVLQFLTQHSLIKIKIFIATDNWRSSHYAVRHMLNPLYTNGFFLLV